MGTYLQNGNSLLTYWFARVMGTMPLRGKCKIKNVKCKMEERNMNNNYLKFTEGGNSRVLKQIMPGRMFTSRCGRRGKVTRSSRQGEDHVYQYLSIRRGSYWRQRVRNWLRRMVMEVWARRKASFFKQVIAGDLCKYLGEFA